VKLFYIIYDKPFWMQFHVCLNFQPCKREKKR